MKAKHKGWPLPMEIYLTDALFADINSIEDKQTKNVFLDLKKYILEKCEFSDGYINDMSRCKWDELNSIVNQK